MPRSGYRYGAWHGGPDPLEPPFDVRRALDEIGDDVLAGASPSEALRRLLQQGTGDPRGLRGLDDLRRKVRQQARQARRRGRLDGTLEQVRELLDRAVAAERRELFPDPDDSARFAEAQLDALPNDPARAVRELSEYQWRSDEARQAYEEIKDLLRREVLDSQFRGMRDALRGATQEDVARVREMVAALNEMLAADARGEHTQEQFDRFMEQYGDFFPENPQNLDELLEVLARRMAAMQAMLNSMTPEQRAQISALSDQLLEDMDLRWQVEQLGSQLQGMFPDMGWGQDYDFRGQDPMGMSQAASTLEELGDLDRLEQLLRNAANPGALAEADIDRARELLGDDAARSLDELGRLTRMLQEAGLIDQREGRLELTPKGLRRIGKNALNDLFEKLARDKLGRHELERSGVGHERNFETKPYEYGDPFNLQIERTVRNAVARAGGGTPVRLHPDDFEVERTEQLVRSSTVLMLDLSLSMPMRDNFLAAKKVAMALHSLISTQFPRDYLGLVGFSEVAREIRPQDLPEVSWDFVYGTNMQHGFQISRRLLSRQAGTKQIIMITDGEPTAHFEPGMPEPFFSYPPVRETVDATLREVVRCTRDGIRINTFMLDPNGHLRTFVEKLTRLNQGRAFFTSPETLGDYLLVDFIEQKREMRRAGGGRRSA